MKRIALVGLVLTGVLASCGSNNAYNSNNIPVDTAASNVYPKKIAINDENRQLANSLKASLERMQESLPEKDKLTAQFVDVDHGLAYDAQLGFIAIDVGKVDPSIKKIRFLSGATLPIPTTQADNLTKQNLSALVATKCSPYYQVRSKAGYAGISASIRPYGASGMEAGEASYNYLGLYGSSVFEGGMFTSAGTNYSQGYWYAYARTSTSFYNLRDFNPQNYPTSPPQYGATPNGSQYTMKLAIPYNGYVNYTVTSTQTGYSKTYQYAVSFATTSGTGQTWGRTTSLLINKGYNSTGDNYWTNSSLKYGFPSSDNTSFTLWTSDKTTPGYPKFVYANTGESPNCGGSASINRLSYSADYNDTINITQSIP